MVIVEETCVSKLLQIALIAVQPQAKILLSKAARRRGLRVNTMTNDPLASFAREEEASSAESKMR